MYLTSNWRKHKLPVDDQLLQMSKCHFLRLTDRAVSWVHRDSVKIDGILLSLKCFRTTTVSSKMEVDMFNVSNTQNFILQLCVSKPLQTFPLLTAEDRINAS